MKHLKIIFYFIVSFCICSCKSNIKEQKDKLYSRHLQRQIDLTIITTKLPAQKEDMNLLLFNDSKYLDKTRAKKIIDSLYKNKQIEPLILVGFNGLKKEYGLEEIDGAEAKQYKKFNEFVIKELFPFIKKKASIRKFKSVSICGFGASALSAFNIAWNNDEKIETLGMFDTQFELSPILNDSVVMATIDKLRKRPNLKIWMSANSLDSTSKKFKSIMEATKSITECTLVLNDEEVEITSKNFTSFLIWAYQKK